MGLFVGYLILTCGCFYLFFSFYYAKYISNLCLFMGDDKDEEVRKYLSSKKEDADSLLMMNLVNMFVVSFLSLIIFGSIEDNSFNFLYFLICLFIFVIASLILHMKKMKSKLYLKIKEIYLLKIKLEEIGNLIDNLESRKSILVSYDKNDKYRSQNVIDEELKDLDLSIKLLKEMYSNIELNHSYKKVNDLFNSLKEEDVFTNQGNLEEFQNKIDIMNARKNLDKNIDINLEKLKNKYK